MLSLFQNARVSLAVSLCDGFPGSAREAIWAGAFPIESIGSCVGEWLIEGVTCLLVDPHEPATIAKALERALTDDALVDLATQSNSDVIKKLTIEEVKVAAVREYQRLLQLTHVNRKG
jgi:glycosyltransferase involved in cell wall biosynthesis